VSGPFTMIPFNRADISETSLAYLAEAIQLGHISGNGPFTHKCERLLEQTTGVPRALLTTSCTHALEMAALLLDIQPGDRVIVPAFTFVSTINAFVLRGAQPVFADIIPETLNIDEAVVGEIIDEATAAVLAVHYGGVACNMSELQTLCRSYGASLVEDNAHGLFGAYQNRALGTFGCLATLSFHETKNYTCGEGGALLINDQRLVDRAEILREKGTNRAQFFRGVVDKYTWMDLGSSYIPSDMLAAILLGQLQSRDTIQQRRRTIWNLYDHSLRAWATDNGVRQPTIPSDCDQSYHLYYLILPTSDHRDSFIHHMRERGVMCVFHYVPLNTSPMGLRHGGAIGQCPVAEDLSARLVRLPFFTSLQLEEQERVITAVLEYGC
jgi:dTDP-4-amino-4,6-dideoxygalactose transaminase